MAREYTDEAMRLVEEGLVDKDSMIRDLLCWLSDHDVKEFLEHHGLGEGETE
jgi:hypothetical protein